MFSQILPQKDSDSAGHCPTISKVIIQISVRKLIREMVKGVNLENCASSGKLLATLLSYSITAYTATSVQVILSVDFTFSGLSIMATAHGRHIFFTPTPLLGSPAPATILTSPSSATGPGNFDSFTVVLSPVM